MADQSQFEKRIPFTAALCQMQLRPGDIEANLKTIQSCCEQAIDPNKSPHHPDDSKWRYPDLLVFPELATIGYDTHPAVHKEQAQTQTDWLARKLRDLARQFKVGLLVGMAERDSTKRNIIYDSALCIDDRGTITGCYRKAHIFSADENHFEQGNSLAPVLFKGINLGVMICADIRSPETARSLEVQGAQILIGLTHWQRGNSQERETLLPARAVENFLPLIDVNAYSYSEEREAPYGGSIALDERGKRIAYIPSGSPKVELVTFLLWESGKKDKYCMTHYQRHPELYGHLVGKADNKHEWPNPSLPDGYARYLTEQNERFKDRLLSALSEFKGARSGYVGFIDDQRNLQIRIIKSPEPGAFIVITTEQGTAGYVARTNKPYKWKGDALNPKDPYFIASDIKVKSELVAPIRVGEGVAGVILLDSYETECFSRLDAETILLRIANDIGEVIERAPAKPARLASGQRPEEIQQILDMANTVLSLPLTPAPESAIKLIAERILGCAMEATKAMRGNIAMVDGELLKIIAAQGDSTEAFKDIDLKKTQPSGIKGWVIHNRNPYYAPNVRGNPARGFQAVEFYRPTHEDVVSEFAVPLLNDEGEAIGVINLESKTEHVFDVELFDPGRGDGIAGGYHYYLFSSLAIIGARMIAITQLHHNRISQKDNELKSVEMQMEQLEHDLALVSFSISHLDRQIKQLLQGTDKRLGKLPGKITDMLDAETNRIQSFLEELRRIGKNRPPEVTLNIAPFDGKRFLKEFVPENLFPDIHIEHTILGGGMLHTDKMRLGMVLRKLVFNAQTALLKSKVKDPEIKIVLDLKTDKICLVVENNGPDTADKVAAETSGTNDNLHGEGLGKEFELAAVEKIIARYKGNMRQEERSGGGCRIVLELPKYVEPDEAAAPPSDVQSKVRYYIS
ncbi:MAG: GAF domain-containing protein [Gammaproteobacteria bacterium]|nr:GAF domain-containing protein [Gammaproteobacteria bacterium]